MFWILAKKPSKEIILVWFLLFNRISGYVLLFHVKGGSLVLYYLKGKPYKKKVTMAVRGLLVLAKICCKSITHLLFSFHLYYDRRKLSFFEFIFILFCCQFKYLCEIISVIYTTIYHRSINIRIKCEKFL